jgi:selenocysteine lyase/cysteine desulfurase
VGTIALAPATRAPEQLALALAEHKIAVGAGHFYAVRCLEGLGIDPENGVLRISLVHYNSQADIDGLLSALDSTL